MTAKKNTISSPTKNHIAAKVYKDDSSHTSDSLVYDESDDSMICVSKKPCNLPIGAKPYCYSNDEEHPDDNQFCAYEKNGVLIGADGCCNKVCPSEHCPSTKGNSQKPEKERPAGSPPPIKKSKNQKSEPFPFLMKMILLVFVILLVVAGIFLSVAN